MTFYMWAGGNLKTFECFCPYSNSVHTRKKIWLIRLWWCQWFLSFQCILFISFTKNKINNKLPISLILWNYQVMQMTIFPVFSTWFLLHRQTNEGKKKKNIQFFVWYINEDECLQTKHHFPVCFSVFIWFFTK